MPFDGIIARQPRSWLPLEIQILDRARELIATPDDWTTNHLSAYDSRTASTQYCLYGALLQAESEIAIAVPGLSLLLTVGDTQLYPRTTAFLNVHRALNDTARPFLRFFNRDSAHAMRLNDRALSLRAVHKLMERARTKLWKRLDQDALAGK